MQSANLCEWFPICLRFLVKIFLLRSKFPVCGFADAYHALNRYVFTTTLTHKINALMGSVVLTGKCSSGTVHTILPLSPQISFVLSSDQILLCNRVCVLLVGGGGGGRRGTW